MEDLHIIEAVERYITGAMSPDERMYFEQLRKTNPEVDQMVVEHTFFLQQLNRYDESKKFRAVLNEAHTDLAEKGGIQSPRLQGRAKVVYLFNRYKKTAAIAASIAGVTALTFSALVWSVSPAKPVNKTDLTNLSRSLEGKITKITQENAKLNQKIDNVIIDQKQPDTPPVYTSGGTGFLIDTKGYLVTNAHVVQNARNIAVQNSEGKDLHALVVFTDITRDLAILKIDDPKFKSPSAIPYTIRKTNADIAEPIFTLGYPRNDIVYGDGYIAAKTGFKGDTLSCQISIDANRGNSGSPVLNKNGEVIGILSAKQNTAEGAVFALQSKYIHQAMTQLQKDTSFKDLKIPASSSLKSIERTQQVKKIADFVYMVKVN
jgi:S1-C subfamily serine protease